MDDRLLHRVLFWCGMGIGWLAFDRLVRRRETQAKVLTALSFVLLFWSIVVRVRY